MLGREDKSPDWVDSEKWSDFCDGPKPGEWWEETMGICGFTATYLAMVRTRGIKVMPIPSVAIYLVPMPYEPGKLEAYNNIYVHITKCTARSSRAPQETKCLIQYGRERFTSPLVQRVMLRKPCYNGPLMPL